MEVDISVESNINVGDGWLVFVGRCGGLIVVKVLLSVVVKVVDYVLVMLLAYSKVGNIVD